MFRELVRKKKQISHDECVELLVNEKRGVLAVLGDGDYPYAMPMNHFYNSDDGCIYFHCGKIGHRLEALKRCDKVSFCVCEQGTAQPGEWALDVRSVIVFGRMELLEDIEVIADISARLSRKFTQDEEYITNEIKNHAHLTLLMRLRPEHICGKLVKEA